MRIANVYRPMVLGCQVDETLSEVARQMTDQEIGALAVLSEDHVMGIITERDLTTALAELPDPASASAAEYASMELRTADLDEDSHEVARRMLEAGVRHLPVTDGEHLVGMVSMRDLLALETWTG